MKNGAPETRLARLAHTVRRHTQLGRSVRTAHIPFSRQRRERLGLFSPVDLSFDPARARVGNGRTVRSRSLLLVHLYAGSRETAGAQRLHPTTPPQWRSNIVISWALLDNAH